MKTEADEVFLDLEDAVPVDAKVNARGQVVAALTTHRYPGKTRTVRVNGTDTKWCFGDIAALVKGCGDQLDCVMVPKVQGADDVHFVDKLLSQLEAETGREHGIGLELQIETALGLENIASIAAASPRVEALVFGPVDFATSMQFPSLHQGPSHLYYPGDFWHYFSVRLAVAGRAYGLQVIDGPYAEIQDLEGLSQVARRVAALGFDGKWAIHPTQVPILNEIFSPSEAEVAAAFEVIRTYDAASESGRGAEVLRGVMIDGASYRMAVQTLDRARRAGVDFRPKR